MKKQDQQNKEFEEFYYPDEPDLKMPPDFFEPKLKDEIRLPEIEWEDIADDDFIFRYEDYVLRVEQMDKKYWWWAVYCWDVEIAFDNIRARTELEAKLLAERAFIKHLVADQFKKK